MSLVTMNWTIIHCGPIMILLRDSGVITAFRACCVLVDFILVCSLQSFGNHIEDRTFTIFVENGPTSHSLTRNFLRRFFSW